MVSEETGRISIAAFGELTQGISTAEAMERINLHFGVERPGAVAIDQYPADIPLENTPMSPAAGSSERVNQP